MDSPNTHDDLVYCFRCYAWHRKGRAELEHYKRDRVSPRKSRRYIKEKEGDTKES